MRVHTLQLIFFRNRKEWECRPSPGITVFTGPNGCGKTNLLEAVYFASVGKSFRTGQNDDLLLFGEEEGTVLLDFSQRNVVHQIKAKLKRKESTRFFVNETKIRRKDLLGTFRTVLFTPDELQLIKGAPQERRRFLDMEVSQVSPRYYEEILRYSRAVQQRNAALRQAQISGKKPDIDMWDTQIARGAEYIVRKRRETVWRMNEILAETEAILTGNHEKLSIFYQSSIGEEFPDESRYLEELAKARAEDERLCHTSVGPHRDDLVFFLDDRDISRFGSQGQQRTAILAMKLSEMEFIRLETGEYPVLLLDDIGSELDGTRRKALFDFLEKGNIQAFVTSADYMGIGEEIPLV